MFGDFDTQVQCEEVYWQDYSLFEEINEDWWIKVGKQALKVDKTILTRTMEHFEDQLNRVKVPVPRLWNPSGLRAIETAPSTFFK